MDKGTWQAPDCQQEQILALEAQLKSVRQSMGHDNKKKSAHSKNKKPSKAPRPRVDIQWMFDPPPEGRPYKKR